MGKNTKSSVCEHVHVHGFLGRDHVHNIYIHVKLVVFILVEAPHLNKDVS